MLSLYFTLSPLPPSLRLSIFVTNVRVHHTKYSKYLQLIRCCWCCLFMSFADPFYKLQNFSIAMVSVFVFRSIPFYFVRVQFGRVLLYNYNIPNTVIVGVSGRMQLAALLRNAEPSNRYMMVSGNRERRTKTDECAVSGAKTKMRDERTPKSF